MRLTASRTSHTRSVSARSLRGCQGGSETPGPGQVSNSPRLPSHPLDMGTVVPTTPAPAAPHSGLLLLQQLLLGVDCCLRWRPLSGPCLPAVGLRHQTRSFLKPHCAFPLPSRVCMGLSPPSLCQGRLLFHPRGSQPMAQRAHPPPRSPLSSWPCHFLVESPELTVTIVQSLSPGSVEEVISSVRVGLSCTAELQCLENFIE